MKSSYSFQAVILIFACLFAIPCFAEIYSDTEFDESAWAHQIYIESTSGQNNVTIEKTIDGGSPGAAQAGTHIFNVPGLLWYMHFFVQASHDPAVDTPFNYVSSSLDVFVDPLTYDCGSFAAAVAFAFVVCQGDDCYYANYIAPYMADGWTHMEAQNLSAADYLLLLPDGNTDIDVHPDFSASGAPLEFGYATGNSTGVYNCTRGWRVDNYTLERNVQVANEPMSWSTVKASYR